MSFCITNIETTNENINTMQYYIHIKKFSLFNKQLH